MAARKLGDLAAAKLLIEEGLALKRETGNRSAILHSLLEIGTLATTAGDYTGAREQLREALRLARETEATAMAHYVLLGLAALDMETGARERAAMLVAFVRHQSGLAEELKSCSFQAAKC